MRFFGPVFLAALLPIGAFAQSAQGNASAASAPAQATTTASPSAASSPQVTSVKVQNFGVYSAVSASTDKPATAGISFAAVKDVHLAKRTRTIPIGKGVNFGFQYVAVGKPLGEKATLHFVVIYPSPGLKKPGSSTPIPRDEYDDKVRIGVKGSFDGYELDNDWEMAPGDWTLEIWSGTNKLASETFTLVKQ